MTATNAKTLYHNSMSKNKVWLSSDDIIMIDVVGDQNAASVELMGREVSVFITRLRGRRKPVCILDSLLEMGKVDPKGRALVVELGKQLHYDRLAMLGTSGVLRIGANLMLRAINKSNIRFFTNRDAALEWLKANEQKQP